MLSCNEIIWKYYLGIRYIDIIFAQDIMIKLKDMFIFWIRFDVFCKANI
jgi:hypothetical protein